MDLIKNQQNIGELIKKQRIDMGYDINKIAIDLNIKLYFLNSIESGNFAALPGSTYAIGFIKSYANYIGLNGEEIINNITTKENILTFKKNYTFYSIQNTKKFFSISLILLTILIAMIAIIYLANNRNIHETKINKIIMMAQIDDDKTSSKRNLQTNNDLLNKIIKNNNEIIKKHILFYPVLNASHQAKNYFNFSNELTLKVVLVYLPQLLND
jgi:cytoskeletal protein RodZ